MRQYGAETETRPSGWGEGIEMRLRRSKKRMESEMSKTETTTLVCSV